MRRAICLLVAAAALTGPATASGVPTSVRDYDLGQVDLPDRSPMGPLPVRLRGVIAIPAGPGPHPLAVVVHGRHGDNCPRRPGQEFGASWPCFRREQRNDRGLRHVLAALAARGVAGISPGVNAAYTFGWGPDDDERRWPAIITRTLAELRRDARSGEERFGVRVRRRLSFNSLGLLGHSRSGHNAARLARRGIPAGGSRLPVRALFLLAPVHEGVPLADVPTAVVASACDGDVPGQAKRYLEAARRRGDRTAPVFGIRLAGANHNFFNTTLSNLGIDDGRFAPARNCTERQRLESATQQSWIDSAAASFFAATLNGLRRPSWMRRDASPRRLYGVAVTLERLFP